MSSDHGDLYGLRIQPDEPTSVAVGTTVVWIDTSIHPHAIKCVHRSLGGVVEVHDAGGPASTEGATPEHVHDALYAALAHVHDYEAAGAVATHAQTPHSGTTLHALDGALHSGTEVLPTQGQKNALAGSQGTPGVTNPYVTTQDARLSDARTPTAHTHDYAASDHAHAGGGSSPESFYPMAADVPNSSNVTAVNAISVPNLAAGTYLYKFWACYRAAATTTGMEMWANFTGTVSRFLGTWYTLTTGGAAATGIADQATTATAQMLEGKGQRVKDTASGPMQGVDSANADQFAVMEGLFIATGSGSFEIKFRSEVLASAVTVMAGSTLTLTKVA